MKTTHTAETNGRSLLPGFNGLASSGRILVLGIGLTILAGALEAQDVARLEELRLEQLSADHWELLLESSGDLDLVGLQEDAEGLRVQLPRHDLAPGIRDLAFADGLVEGIRVLADETSRGPMVRLHVVGRGDLASSFRSEGSIARISLWPSGLESQEDALRRRVEELETELVRVERRDTELARAVAELARQQRDLRDQWRVAEKRREALDPQLRTALENARGTIRRLSEDFRRAEDELATSRLREESLVRELEEAEDRFESARIQATETLQRQQEELARLEAENERLRSGLLRRDQELLDLRTGTTVADDLPHRPAVEESRQDAPDLVQVPVTRGARESATGGPVHLIVVATGDDREAAERRAGALRELGYDAEVYESISGHLLVLLGRLPYRDAIRLRDEAIDAGNVPRDAYLIRQPSPESAAG